MRKPGLHQASCKKAPLHGLPEEPAFKERIKELVRQGVIVSRSLIKSTMDQIEGECDEVLLGVSQLYETTSTSEGLEETHVSVELLLEASQVNSNHDEGIVEVTDKRIFEASRFGDPMKSIEIDTIRKVGVPVSTKWSTPWAVNIWEVWVNRLRRKREVNMEIPFEKKSSSHLMLTWKFLM